MLRQQRGEEREEEPCRPPHGVCSLFHMGISAQVITVHWDTCWTQTPGYQGRREDSVWGWGPVGVGRGNLLPSVICQPVTFIEHWYWTRSCSRYYISGCTSCFSWLYKQRVCLQDRVWGMRNRKLESCVDIRSHSTDGAISFLGGEHFRKRDFVWEKESFVVLLDVLYKQKCKMSCTVPTLSVHLRP